MLRTIIVSRKKISHYLHSVLADIGGVSIVRVVDRYFRDAIDLSRTLRAHAPQAVFLSTQNPARALALASHIDKVMPGVQVVRLAFLVSRAVSWRSCVQVSGNSWLLPSITAA